VMARKEGAVPWVTSQCRVVVVKVSPETVSEGDYGTICGQAELRGQTNQVCLEESAQGFGVRSSVGKKLSRRHIKTM
jgi:plastocyanin domain-containing protein